MKLKEKEGDQTYLDGYLTLKEMLDMGMLVLVPDAEESHPDHQSASKRDRAEQE